MNALLNRLFCLHDIVLNASRHLDGLAPLFLRLYLVPVFWMAGTEKLGFYAEGASWLERLTVEDSVVEWFGNAEWGLGLPFPELMASLAAYTEFFGAIALALGLLTRWISLPLMVTMIVAAVTVHWEKGWNAIAQSSNPDVAERLGKAKEILQEHGNYDWLTETGNFVVLNNGIEFAATYFIMLLTLFFIGGGRYVSADWWLHRFLRR
ncbi:MAG: DoxX family protein [Gammaproteobacteria bacterium]|nr:DoxX family protein [Gammaproteobacteria bacterium]